MQHNAPQLVSRSIATPPTSFTCRVVGTVTNSRFTMWHRR